MLAAAVSAALGQAYMLTPGDALTVTIVDEPAVSGVFTVDPDGAITMPVAGAIRVQGLTLDRATSRITAALKLHITDPSVTVVLRAGGDGDVVYVLRQVARTGSYKMARGETLAPWSRTPAEPRPRRMPRWP